MPPPQAERQRRRRYRATRAEQQAVRRRRRPVRPFSQAGRPGPAAPRTADRVPCIGRSNFRLDRLRVWANCWAGKSPIGFDDEARQACGPPLDQVEPRRAKRVEAPLHSPPAGLPFARVLAAG